MALQARPPMRAVPVSSSIRGRPHPFLGGLSPWHRTGLTFVAIRRIIIGPALRGANRSPPNAYPFFRPRTHRPDPDRQGPAPGHRRLRALPEARKRQPGWIDQGSHRPVDDRSGRKARRPEARRHPGRRHRRQYRPGPGTGGPAEGLQADPGGAGQDEPGEDLQPEGDGCRSAPDPLGRGQGSPEYYQDLAKTSPSRPRARTSSTSSATRTTRPHTNSAPARRSSSRWAAIWMPSCSAVAAPAP